MGDSLLDPDQPLPDDYDEQTWADRSLRDLDEELALRKRRLEARNPIVDPDGYVDAFRVVVALQAHLRDRSD